MESLLMSLVHRSIAWSRGNKSMWMIVGMVMVVMAEQDSRGNKIISCRSSNSNSGHMKLGTTRATGMAQSTTVPHSSNNNNHDKSRFLVLFCVGVCSYAFGMCACMSIGIICVHSLLEKKESVHMRAWGK